MNSPAITICLCTFKRPQFLERLLNKLDEQETEGLFTYSLVVVDNDLNRSSEATVSVLSQKVQFKVLYTVEPVQSIALARNRAVSNATGDYIAIIDDDEFPTKTWLLEMYKTCTRFNASGVLGPVKRHFDEDPPGWILRGSFFQRPSQDTGTVIHWENTRTGNVLLKTDILRSLKQPFNPEFRSGSDKEFFRRMMQSGRRFVWSDEGVVFEVVPPARWKRKYLLRRALLRGASAAKRNDGAFYFIKSWIAVPVYALALPFALLLGHHRFMTLFVKLCDHLGKVLAMVGLNPIKDAYVSE